MWKKKARELVLLNIVWLMWCILFAVLMPNKLNTLFDLLYITIPVYIAGTIAYYVISIFVIKILKEEDVDMRP